MTLPAGLRIALLALESDQDIVGPETRRTGRMLILASVAVLLIATGSLQPEAVSGPGLRLSGDASTMSALLVLFLCFGLVMFPLRLLTDLERVNRVELRSRTVRLQLRTEAEVRRLEEAELLERYQPPPGEREATTKRTERDLTTRLEHLSRELADLRSLGETGSRFTRFSADRQIVEAEVRRLLGEVDALRASEEGSSEVEAPLPPRLRISADHLDELDELSRLQEDFTSSGLVRVARRLRIALDVCLAPGCGVCSLIFWWSRM